MIYSRAVLTLLCLAMGLVNVSAFVQRPVLNPQSSSSKVVMSATEGFWRDMAKKTAAGVLGALALSHTLPIIPAHQALAADYNVEGSKYKMGKALNAPTGSGTRVNKDPESLLRYGLPINSKKARELQAAVEGVKSDILIKRWGAGIAGVQKARTVLGKEAELLKEVRPSAQAEGKKAIQELKDLLDPLEQILASKEGTGTVQEREKLDKAYAAQDKVARAVGALEELMVPENFAREIPEEYAGLPRLNGRATVEMVLVKGPEDEDGKFDVEGTLYDECRLVLTLDGYNAPVSAGTVMDLVDKGFYKGLTVIRSDGFVVQTGDPDPESDKVDGYTPPGSKKVRTVPLEIAVAGDPEMLYGATTEDDGRGFAQTVLPFQAYGALGMARTEAEPDSASSQFFFLLFDSDLTPAGKNLLDGRYTNFGYVTEGADILKDVKEGDIIKSAKILTGKSGLVQP